MSSYITIVLGAGASYAFGEDYSKYLSSLPIVQPAANIYDLNRDNFLYLNSMPLSKELKKFINDLFNDHDRIKNVIGTVNPDLLRTRDIFYKCKSIYSDHHKLFNSIDDIYNYFKNHPSNKDHKDYACNLIKILTSYLITIKSIKHLDILRNSSAVNWIDLLFQIFNSFANQQRILTKLRIISFNYDPLFGWYFINKLTESGFADYFKSSQIIHAHGSIVNEYENVWNKYENIRKKDGKDFLEDYHTSYLQELSWNKILFTEDNSEVQHAYQTIEDSRLIIFLGFGYGDDNCKKILPNTSTKDKAVLGTYIGSKTNRNIVLYRLNKYLQIPGGSIGLPDDPDRFPKELNSKFQSNFIHIDDNNQNLADFLISNSEYLKFIIGKIINENPGSSG